ncbi:hypothetical protein MKEN_01237900 [Mycena kentingensis (nom. inval.)]|nr:hypothetical protein MKEN_01237900 [Mycena kentingensis (nom. inval.)]
MRVSPPWDPAPETRLREELVILELRSIVSPMRRFPTELLAEVFVHTLPSTAPEAEATSHDHFTFKISPWGLVHICSRWRNVAVSTPSLWRRVVVAFTPNRDDLPYPLPLLRTPLQRSPRLEVVFNGSHEASAAQSAALSLLLDYADKIVYLRAVLPLELLAAFERTIGNHCTSLRRLYIRLFCAADQGTPILRCFEDAPKLSELCIEYGGCNLTVLAPT